MNPYKYKSNSSDPMAETRVTNPLDVPKPTDTSNYDFESHNISAETDLHSSSGMGESLPSSYEDTAVTEKLPANKGALASKAAEAKAPMNAPAKPLKTIAQEVAEVKAPPAPKSPLPGQGAKATGPVEPAFYNEAGNKVSKPNLAKPIKKITPPKVESSNPAPAAEKVMTPEGSVEKIAAKAPAKASGASMSAASLNKEGMVRVAPPKAEGMVRNYPARLRLEGDAGAVKNFGQSSVDTGTKVAASAEKAGPSLAAKAASTLRKAPAAVKGLKSLAKGVGEVADDMLLGGATKPYRELMARRAAGTAAKSGIKAIGGEALALGKGVTRFGGNLAKGVAVQASGEGGYKLGKNAKETMEEAKSTAESQTRQGAKYGLKVTSSADTSEGSNFLTQTARDVGNAVKIAAGYGDPTPQVSEDPALKAKFMAANKKRIKNQ